ncbi:MAG: hypothetical protein RI924_1499, partial [Bacteroidota bacterium]
MFTSIILVFAALVFSLQFRPVQTYFAQRLAAYLSEELNTRVAISGLYIQPFKSLVLEGLYIQDLDKDTLLHAKVLSLNINELSLNRRRISISTLRLSTAQFYLKKYEDKSSNLNFIINYFNTGSPERKERKPFELIFKEIKLDRVTFKYKNLGVETKVNGINYNDLHIQNLKGIVRDLDTKNNLAKASIKGLSFREKSGFYLKSLSTLAIIDSNKMEFRGLELITPSSIIRNYFVMEFKSFDDFNQFNDRVYMNGRFSKSRVVSADIAYFAPALSKNYFDVKVDGRVSGYVKHLKAQKMNILSGEKTVLKGDFSIKGLPVIKNTLFELEFDELATNKKDFERIIQRISGNSNSKLPDVFN